MPIPSLSEALIPSLSESPIPSPSKVPIPSSSESPIPSPTEVEYLLDMQWCLHDFFWRLHC